MTRMNRLATPNTANSTNTLTKFCARRTLLVCLVSADIWVMTLAVLFGRESLVLTPFSVTSTCLTDCSRKYIPITFLLSNKVDAVLPLLGLSISELP